MIPLISEVETFLISQGFLDSNGKIIDHNKFKELLFAVFLAHIVQERVKRFWERDYLEEKNITQKHKKIKPFFHLPFHFIGINKKTAFIAEKSLRDRIFHEEFMPSLIGSYEDIDIFRRLSSLHEITNETIYSKHTCTRGTNVFCKDCKSSFSEELLSNHSAFFKNLNVKSYIILDIPLELLKYFISEDDLIEEVEDLICGQCGRVMLDHYKHCPDCGKAVSKRETRENQTNREKMFNVLLSIYLGSRTSAERYDANKPIHQGTHETDVYLSRGAKALLLEGTTQVAISKEYVVQKGLLFLVIKATMPNYKIRLLLWSLDKDCNSTKNKAYIKDLAPESDLMLWPSKLSDKILSNPTISIPQNDLNLLRGEVNELIEGLAKNAELFLG